MTITRIYDESDFWAQLQADILSAVGAVDIHVPFISKQAMARWEPVLQRCLARAVRVRVYLQEPRGWERRADRTLPAKTMADLAQFELLVNWLRSIVTEVHLRARMHAKIILIDEHILWEGSLNFLSHFDTTEHLRRSINPREVKDIRRRHMLEHIDARQSRENLSNQICALIDRRVRELQIKQVDLARALGCDPSYVSRLKKGSIAGINGFLHRLLLQLGYEVIVVPSYLAGPTRKFIDTAMQSAAQPAAPPSVVLPHATQRPSTPRP